MTQIRPDNAEILDSVGAYYSRKLREHGPTARGADWRDEASQALRFQQLLRAIDAPQTSFSITEIGCGYGALADYLRNEGFTASYVGCDVSEDMVAAASQRHIGFNASFFVGSEAAVPTDYVVASGIFNVRFSFGEEAWLDYVEGVIDNMTKMALQAVAFNVLTGHSDTERKEARLWYPAPGALLDRLIERYGFRVAALHDYPLYEFTVSIRTKG